MDIRKIYEYALQREYEGKRFFETNAARMSHATAVTVFKQLAGEEQKHIEFVQAQLDAIDAGKSADVAFGEELNRSGVFSQRAASEFIDQTVLEAMVPDLPILRMAYLIERDLLNFMKNPPKKPRVRRGWYSKPWRAGNGGTPHFSNRCTTRRSMNMPICRGEAEGSMDCCMVRKAEQRLN
jgi:hypothetical protein